MREIKFRGRRLDNKEWVFGNLALCDNGRAYIHQLVDADEDCWLHWEVDPNTIGQFTGWTTIDSKLIYEDDFMEQLMPDGTRRVLLVSFGDNDTRLPKSKVLSQYGPEAEIKGFYFKWHDMKLYPSIRKKMYLDIEEMKIIGNIHDNLDLLGECAHDFTCMPEGGEQ